MRLLGAIFFVILFFVLPACKKDAVAPDISKIHIDGFLLKKADNGFLFETDTVGTIHDDTITVTLPGGGSPTFWQLTPTISFTGDSISPKSGTVQDFTQPLSYTVYGPHGAKKKYFIQVVYSSKNQLFVNGDRLYAVDLGTGVVRWIAEDNWSVNKITSSSVISGDTVFTCLSTGFIFAARAVDGSQVWSQFSGNGLIVTPAIDNGLLYAGCSDGTITALWCRSGLVAWTKKLDLNGVFTGPVVSNHILYFQFNQKIYAMNGATGDTLWTNPLNADFYASVTAGDNLVYVSGMDSTMYALNKNNGSIAWRLNLGANANSPALTDGTLYVATANDSLFAIDALTGAKKWSVFVNTGPSNPHVSYPGIQSIPVVYNNMVIVGGGDPNVYAFDILTGQQVWMSSIGDMVRGGIPCVDGVLYINTGNLYALDAGSGNIKWTQTNLGANLSASVISKNGTVYNAKN